MHQTRETNKLPLFRNSFIGVFKSVSLTFFTEVSVPSLVLTGTQYTPGNAFIKKLITPLMLAGTLQKAKTGVYQESFVLPLVYAGTPKQTWECLCKAPFVSPLVLAGTPNQGMPLSRTLCIAFGACRNPNKSGNPLMCSLRKSSRWPVELPLCTFFLLAGTHYTLL